MKDIINTFKGRKLGSRKISEAHFTESLYRKNLHMPVHSHRVPSVSIVLKGGYLETIDKKACIREKGTVVFHAFDESHEVNFFDKPTQILRIKPALNWLNREKSLTEVFDAPSEFQNWKIGCIATRLYIEYHKNDEFASLAIQGLLLELLAEAGRFSSRQTGSDEEPKWLKRVKEMLREEFDSKMSLDDLAACAGVHPVYLSREFRRRLNCTIGEFVRNLRVEKACHLLTRSDKSISEIANSIGFYDQSHFTNTFKHLTGITPAEYRSNFKNG